MSILRGVPVVIGMGLVSAASLRCGGSTASDVVDETATVGEASAPPHEPPPWHPPLPPPGPRFVCTQVDSVGSTGCTDAGGYRSTCATARCPGGYTLTGGGGACSAGDRKVKSLFPRVDRGEFSIACEEQGVDPVATAICCKL